MPLREVLDTADSIAQGLAAAHAAGIVHRDLKPENIFLTKDGRVKILDFGLAKFDPVASENGSTLTVQQATNPGHVLGTVGYMSPEQVRGKPADGRSDIFALGVILYEMVTGQPAFRKETGAETMSAILKEDPPAISQYSSTTPPGFQRVIARCLTKNPEQRFQHASDVGFALEALSDTSTGAIAVEQTEKRAGERTLLWIALAVAVVSLAALAFYLWQRPTAVPVVQAVTQLTNDAMRNLTTQLATDGTRVYFNEGEPGSQRIAEVAVVGGATAILPTNVVDPSVLGFSADSSSLLVTSGDTNSVWTVPLPAGEPRKLGDIQAATAQFMPDGRIVYVAGKEIYLAERDGSNPRKLTSIGQDSGILRQVAVSPDGSRMALQSWNWQAGDFRIMVVDSDGTNLRTIVNSSGGSGLVCCPNWSRDGQFVLYAKVDNNGGNLWAYRLPTPFRRSGVSIQLTAGPLEYTQPTPSRDHKQIFAIGIQRRGELIRYDMQTKQFVPFLSGISAWSPTFSTDGNWVAYTSYPGDELWVSRTDGSERKQLTFSPMKVRYAFISPDGGRVAFDTWNDGNAYLIDSDGTHTRKIGHGSIAPNWSPDGKLLVFTRLRDPADLRFRNLESGEETDVPDSTYMDGAQWVTPNELVATSDKDGTLKIFDTKSRTWSTLVEGKIITNVSHTPDYKYVYYTTGGPEPQVMRVRLSDRKSEVITGLKGIRRALFIGNTEMRVAPDGSPIFTRDTGTQEIYALTVKWP